MFKLNAYSRFLGLQHLTSTYLLPRRIQKLSILQKDYLIIVIELLRFFDLDEMALMAVVTRHMDETECNSICSTGPLQHVVLTALESLAAFQSTNSQPLSCSTAATRSDLCWQAPLKGFVKFN